MYVVTTVITITNVSMSGMMCMFSLILILIDWYNTWNKPMERVDMYVYYYNVCLFVCIYISIVYKILVLLIVGLIRSQL